MHTSCDTTGWSDPYAAKPRSVRENSVWLSADLGTNSTDLDCVNGKQAVYGVVKVDQKSPKNALLSICLRDFPANGQGVVKISILGKLGLSCNIVTPLVTTR